MTAPHPPCTVLVIDPCPETHARLVAHVQGRGVSIIAASDPFAARTAIALTAPDIVITDLFLPEGAGLALAHELTARQARCPVIVMGTDAPARAVVQALRAGAVDYLHKPVAEAALAQALHRARIRVPRALADLPGVHRAEYRVTMESDPAHIPRVLSWLMQTTAAPLPDLQRLHLRGALQELLLNAVEHGNLEIFYQKKHQALMQDQYEALLRQRMNRPHLKARQVTIQVVYEKEAQKLTYRIADEGTGFNWRRRLQRAQEARGAEEANGRGIFLARAFFPSLTYNTQGNAVTITVPFS